MPFPLHLQLQRELAALVDRGRGLACRDAVADGVRFSASRGESPFMLTFSLDITA